MNASSLTLESFMTKSKVDLEKKILSTITDKNIIVILKGGKRLRPLLAHLAFKTCTCGKETSIEYQRALEGAIAIELAHSASLVHDDIIDRDKERRGRFAFYVKEGVDNAILNGHKMLAVGFNIALRHGDEIAKLYVDTWNDILAGELKEVNFNKKDIKANLDNFSAESKFFNEYNRIIDMKTASLFSSACKAGAIEAKMSGEILQVFEDYGREIGLAYQLADDLVDLVKGELIDSVLLPLFSRLGNKMSEEDSIKVGPVRKRLQKDSLKIKKIFIDEIKRHIKKAEELSNSTLIPSSPYKELLRETPTYMINQMLNEIKITI
jgi:geranylgeranyl pyrophosphate synthase